MRDNLTKLNKFRLNHLEIHTNGNLKCLTNLVKPNKPKGEKHKSLSIDFYIGNEKKAKEVLEK